MTMLRIFAFILCYFFARVAISDKSPFIPTASDENVTRIGHVNPITLAYE
jgi:hypothetical protein